MFPRLTFSDTPHSAVVDAKFNCDLKTAASFTEHINYLQYLGFRQLRVFVRGAARHVSCNLRSAFSLAVSHVVRTRPNKQVGRVDAPTVIACVANIKAAWYSTVVHLIGQPVSTFNAVPVGSHGMVVNVSANDPVPVAVQCSSPFPTPITNIDMFPKPCLNRCCPSSWSSHTLILPHCINTNDEGSREGYEVCERQRWTSEISRHPRWGYIVIDKGLE